MYIDMYIYMYIYMIRKLHIYKYKITCLHMLSRPAKHSPSICPCIPASKASRSPLRMSLPWWSVLVRWPSYDCPSAVETCSTCFTAFDCFSRFSHVKYGEWGIYGKRPTNSEEFEWFLQKTSNPALFWPKHHDASAAEMVHYGPVSSLQTFRFDQICFDFFHESQPLG